MEVSLEDEENLRIGWQTNARHLTDLVEEFTDSVLVNIEGKVADEQGVGFGADTITVLLSPIGSARLGVGVSRLGSSIVQVDRAVVKKLAVHGLVRLGGGFIALKIDVSETLAAVVVHAVGDDASADKTFKVLESGLQGLIVNAPAQAAGKESSGSGLRSAVSLALLGCSCDLIVRLALLGGRDSGAALLGIGVGGRVSIRVTVRAVAAVRVVLSGVGQLRKIAFKLVAAYLGSLGSFGVAIDSLCLGSRLLVLALI